MDDRVEPDDAARALGEIDRRREQAIRRKIFPDWYWWAYAVLIVEVAAAIESGRGVIIGIGIAVFVVGSLATDLPVRRAARAARPYRGLGGAGTAWKTLLGLAAFVATLFGVLMATALSLHAAGVPHPTTIAAAVAAVLFAVGGRTLVRYEADVLVRRSRTRR